MSFERASHALTHANWAINAVRRLPMSSLQTTTIFSNQPNAGIHISNLTNACTHVRISRDENARAQGAKDERDQGNEGTRLEVEPSLFLDTSPPSGLRLCFPSPTVCLAFPPTPDRSVTSNLKCSRDKRKDQDLDFEVIQ